MSDLLPYVFLPYQQAWMADESKVKFGEKTRRCGLTWAEAADDVLIAAEEGGSDVFYIGYNKDMAREYIETCANWARSFNQVASDVEESILDDQDGKNIFTFTIKFNSGKKIMALSSRPNNLRGKAGVVVIDEAAFIDDLEEILKAAFALLIWGGKVRIISTHDGVENPFNQKRLEYLESKFASVHRITFQDAVSQGLYERICYVSNIPLTVEGELKWIAEIRAIYGDNAEEELDCIPKNGSGAYFKPGLVFRCAQPSTVIRLSKDDQWGLKPEPDRYAEIKLWCEDELDLQFDQVVHDVGLDYARKRDMTSIAVLARQRDGMKKVVLVIELNNVSYAQQKQILFFLIKKLPKLGRVFLDGTGTGQSLAEQTVDEFGSQAVGVSLSQKWYGTFFPLLKTAFENQILIVPDDSDLLKDFQFVILVGGIPSISSKRDSAKGQGSRHGDFAVALCLAHAASLEDPILYGSHRVPLRPTAEQFCERKIKATRGCRLGLLGGGWDE